MPILIYLGIYVAKIIEVSLMTIRVVLITKGERKAGTVVSFVENLLWVFIVGNVLKGISGDPIRGVVYALGFATGTYTGSWLEQKVGIGVSEIKAIVKEEHGDDLAKYIRDQGYAVTMLRGEGKNLKRCILFMYVSRKEVKHVVDMMVDMQSNAVITVSDSKPVYGGYLSKK